MRHETLRADLNEIGYNREEAYFHRLNRELIEKLHPRNETAAGGIRMRIGAFEDEVHPAVRHREEGLFGRDIGTNWA